MTAISVIPLSLFREDLRLAVSVVIFVPFLRWLLRRRRLRPVSIRRYIARNIIRNSRNTLPGLYLEVRAVLIERNVRFAALRLEAAPRRGPRRRRRSRSRPEQLERVLETQV